MGRPIKVIVKSEYTQRYPNQEKSEVHKRYVEYIGDTDNPNESIGNELKIDDPYREDTDITLDTFIRPNGSNLSISISKPGSAHGSLRESTYVTVIVECTNIYNQYISVTPFDFDSREGSRTAALTSIYEPEASVSPNSSNGKDNSNWTGVTAVLVFFILVILLLLLYRNV